MSLRAFTDDYGSFSLPGNYTEVTTSYRGDGSVYSQSTGSFQNVIQRCIRNNHTVNRRVTLGDTETTFLLPSTYDRCIVQESFHSGVWQKTYKTGTVRRVTIEGPPNLLYNVKCFRCAPIFDGTQYVLSDTVRFNQTDVECLLKLKDAKAELGENLAQMRTTVNQLAKTSSTMWRLLLAVRRGNWSYVERTLGSKPLRVGADTYLEIKYGWRPLMQDMYGLTELICQDLPRKGQIMSASRTVEDESSVDGIVEPGYYTHGNASRSHTTRIWARLSDQFARTVAQAGSGLDNPLSLGWELVPYSFVVDWGLPIGNTLSALTATSGLTFVGGFRRVRGEGTVRATRLSGTYTELSPRWAEREYYSFRRTKLYNFPVPTFYAKSPFSTSHVQSALALFTNLVR